MLKKIIPTIENTHKNTIITMKNAYENNTNDEEYLQDKINTLYNWVDKLQLNINHNISLTDLINSVLWKKCLVYKTWNVLTAWNVVYWNC